MNLTLLSLSVNFFVLQHEFFFSNFFLEMLLYVHRNRRFIRDGSPGRPPRLSHSSWTQFSQVSLSFILSRKALTITTPTPRPSNSHLLKTYFGVFPLQLEDGHHNKDDGQYAADDDGSGLLRVGVTSVAINQVHAVCDWTAGRQLTFVCVLFAPFTCSKQQKMLVYIQEGQLLGHLFSLCVSHLRAGCKTVLYLFHYPR